MKKEASKAPTKPVQPPYPIAPFREPETITVEEIKMIFDDDEGGSTENMVEFNLNDIIQLIPEGTSIDKIRLRVESASDYGTDYVSNVYFAFLVEKPNPKYNKLEYYDKLANYENDVKDYSRKMIKYELEKAAYESKCKDSKEAQLEKALLELKHAEEKVKKLQQS